MRFLIVPKLYLGTQLDIKFYLINYDLCNLKHFEAKHKEQSRSQVQLGNDILRLPCHPRSIYRIILDNIFILS